MAEWNIIQAVNDALRLEMRRDPRVVVLGEDVGKFGGVFRATAGLYEEFGPDRVIDTPLAEAGIVGAAIGKLVTVHAGDHQVFEPESAHRLGQVARLERVERSGRARGHVAEAAAARADVAHQHHRGRAAAPAFAHVGTARFLADRVQAELAQRAADGVVTARAGHADLEPRGLRFPLAELHQHRAAV